MTAMGDADGFRLGLALSGAISAGAYTAGVIDFLVEALEAWEAARPDGAVPAHRAGLKVITGASAGAITGAVGLIALARGPEAQPLSDAEVAASVRDPGKHYNPNRCVLQPLYTAWVEQPQLMAEADGTLDFLSLEDLTGTDACVASLLNSKLLDAIKTQALSGTGKQAAERPYLARSMHLYMTVSNLRGIPFSIDFGEATYGMQTHGDRLHYQITGLGSWDWAGSDWLRGDVAVPLSAATLPVHPAQPPPPDWERYGTVALASSAFPIGLASREITSRYADFYGRAYPIDADQTNVIKPCFPGIAAGTDGDYRFLNVDGGLINNSPYDYAEYALLGVPRLREHAVPENTAAAVLMIAPFPEPPAFLPEGQPKAELAAVLRALLPTLMTQARFRTSDLVKAMDPKDYSRFLIAPHRQDAHGQEAEFKIACGALGGFGGFLHRSFRAHDFQLGRRNCQQFLREHLGLPLGAAMVDSQAGQHITAGPNRPTRARVIPLVGTAALEVALPPWPRMNGDLSRLERRIERRVSTLLPLLIRTQTRNARLRFLGRAGLLLGKKKLLDTIKWTILADLVRRDQIAGWDLPAGREDAARKVVAALAAPAFEWRTVAGLERATRLPPAEIDTTLSALRQQPGAARVVQAAWDRRCYTLAARAPRGFWSWPGIDRVGRWLSPPNRDD